MSRNSESYLGGLASSSEQLQSLFDQKTISSLIFPSSPNLKMNDVISSLLQYKVSWRIELVSCYLSSINWTFNEEWFYMILSIFNLFKQVHTIIVNI